MPAHLTWSYCASEVVEGLRQAGAEAKRLHGPLTKPPCLVTDNGPSFAAKRFSRYVDGRYAHVRIRYRVPTHLGLLERFHQTLKKEERYWRPYDSPAHARACIAEFRDRYNRVRSHWALIPEGGGDPVTPQDVYVNGLAVGIPKWQGWAKGAEQRLDQLMSEIQAPGGDGVMTDEIERLFSGPGAGVDLGIDRTAPLGAARTSVIRQGMRS